MPAAIAAEGSLKIRLPLSAWEQAYGLRGPFRRVRQKFPFGSSRVVQNAARSGDVPSLEAYFPRGSDQDSKTLNDERLLAVQLLWG